MGHGLRSDDSRARMEEALEILQRAWRESPMVYEGKYYRVNVPEIRPRPVQQPAPPLWRSAISPNSFTECGRLGIPILTARLPVSAIKDRWALYEAGLDEGNHDTATREKLLAQSALWRNVYVADSDAQAEDELASLLQKTREHMMHVRETGSLYGSVARVREQVAELRDVGVRHLLCQTGFGDMNHEQNLASMRRFGEGVMTAFQ